MRTQATPRRSDWASIEHGWATGTRLWISDKEEAWFPAIVAKAEKVDKQYRIVVTDLRDPSRSLTFLNADNVSETEHMNYMNTSTNANFENLVDLVVLNEPEILHCLESRYKEDKIYTYTGPILIALNPFKTLPELYNKDILEFYYNFGMARSNFLLQQVVVPEPPPHVYAIADKAYRNMRTGVENDFAGKPSSSFDQSILISGESGAGKTESTKLIMQYVTIISSENREATDESSVMDRVLLSNPILEAVGNAKTLRNNNSSRFGKFIELKFNRPGFLTSGFIQTYVLEKVRVVSQQPGERNYHIFYQMSEGGSTAQKERWGVSSVMDFYYTNQGRVASVAQLDDAKGFQGVMDAFDVFDISKTDQACILDVMAAILHLGQMTFVPDNDGEGSLVGPSKEVATSLAQACKLLGVKAGDMKDTLTSRSIIVANSTVLKPLTVTQASDARDAIVKAVYSSFFDWLVSVINKKLVTAATKQVFGQIGILDIFGFEFFKTNSFEQLCINYANEALQQHFVNYVFEYEQKEYREEGIEWSFVEFKNNKNCLDLIDMKKKGIFSMIDDECMIPKGSDANLASRMYKEFELEKSFEASGGNKSKNEFVIHHFAGSVTYSVLSFMDKNRNEFPANALAMLHGSKTPLIPLMFADPHDEKGTGSGASSGKKVNKTVCTQFKEQLTSLIAKIQKTTSHYVRCIKPNDTAAPDHIVRPRVVEQLKCAGVIEVVRLSRSGYPYRMTHKDFFARYRPILTTQLLRRMRISVPKTLAEASSGGSDSGEACMKLVETLNVYFFQNANETYSMSYACQKGKTKIFIPKDEYNLLEGARSKLTYDSATLIQAMCRGRRYRVWYKKAKIATQTIRRFLRNATFRKNIEERVKIRIARKAAELKAAREAKEAQDAKDALERQQKASASSAKEPAKDVPVAEPTSSSPKSTQKVDSKEDINFFSAKDTWAAKMEKNRVLSTKVKAPIGPKSYEAKPDTDGDLDDADGTPGGTGKKVPITLLQVHHKKSTELEKMVYKEQFPKQWTTDRIIKLFQRDNADEVKGPSDVSFSTPRRFPKEKEYTAGQVKLLRVIGATEVAIDKAVVQGITAEIEASGDQMAKKALAAWKKNFKVEADYDKHISGHLYEAKNLEGTRCYCKQFKPVGFPFGNREMVVTRELSAIWQQKHPSENVAATFPFPILLGFLRTDKEITEPSFRKRWLRHFPNADPPEEGELWCIYTWEQSSFKSLRSFAELSLAPTGFMSLGQQSHNDAKWKLMKKVMRLTVEALQFLHNSGYCHNSLSGDCIWLQSFDVNSDMNAQRVKLTDLGLTEKVGDLGAEGNAKQEDDLAQLGFIFVATVISTFANRSKVDIANFRARLTGIKPESLNSLSNTFNVDQQGSLMHKEVQMLYEDVCKGNMATFKSNLTAIPSWKQPMTLFDEAGGVGWNLVVKLISGSKSQLNINDLIGALDRPAPLSKKSSISNILASPIKRQGSKILM